MSTLSATQVRESALAMFAIAAAGYRRKSAYSSAVWAGVFTNVVFGFIRAAIMMALLVGSAGAIAGFDEATLMTYVFLGQGLLTTLHVWMWTELADRVRTGDIAVDLGRPVDLQLSWLAADVGRAVHALGWRLVVPMLVGALAFDLYWPRSLSTWLWFSLSLLLAILLSFALRFLLNLSAFWLLDIRGAGTLYVLASTFFMGAYIPVSFFPEWLHTIAYLTPWPWLMQGPIDIFVNNSQAPQPWVGCAIASAWLVLALGAGRLVLRRAAARLVIQGG